MPIKDVLAKQLSKMFGIPYMPALRFRQTYFEEVKLLSSIGKISPIGALERLFIQTVTRRRG